MKKAKNGTFWSSYSKSITGTMITGTLITGTILSLVIALLFASPSALVADAPDSGQEPLEISGVITTASEGEIVGLEGVQVIFTSTSGETVSLLTNFNGHYSRQVEAGWSGTIKPQKVSYSFEPAELSLSNMGEPRTGQNFTASRGPVITISGTVFNAGGTGLGGVILQPFENPLGFPHRAVVSNADGSYQLTVGTGWTGRIRASKDGYTFSPGFILYDTGVVSDLSGRDYAASVAPLLISGRVTGETGAGIYGVNVSFSNAGGTLETVTDFNGNYRREIPHGWSGVVTLAKSGYIVNHSPRTYHTVRWNQEGQDYIAVSEGHFISGTVTNGDGASIAGVTVIFTNNGGTALTDVNGRYYHAVPREWSGTVRPAKAGYSFFPPERTYTALSHGWPAQSFTGSAAVPVIWGRVSDLCNQPIQGVCIAVSNNGGTPYTYTDEQGLYRFPVPFGWSGTVAPSKPNYTFSPGVKEYSNVNAQLGEQDFKSGTMIPVIWGVVTDSGAKTQLGGVTLRFSNGGGVTETGGYGLYLRPVYLGWTGSLSVEKEGFVFLPSVLEYTDITSNFPGQNVFALPGRIDLALQAERHSSGALTIRRHYAAITVSFNAQHVFDTIPIASTAVFVYKKEGNGQYREIFKISSDDLQAGQTFNYLDKDIRGGETYTYKAVVIFDEVYNIKESNEIEI